MIERVWLGALFLGPAFPLVFLLAPEEKLNLPHSLIISFVAVAYWLLITGFGVIQYTSRFADNQDVGVRILATLSALAAALAVFVAIYGG